MKNKEQTAVEWFFMTMNICGLLPTEEIVEYYNQAKEMERQQKRKDFTDGYMHGSEPLNHDVIDQWYNKTYGDKK